MSKFMRATTGLVLITMFVLSSCGENSEIFIPDESYGNVENFFKSLYQQPETTVFNPEEDFLFSTASDIKIFVPANTLQYGDGSHVADDVKLEFKELNKSGDFIINQITSQTANGYLLADRVFKLDFVSKGETIFVKEGKKIEVVLNKDEKEDNHFIYSWSGSSWRNLLLSELPAARLEYGDWTYASNGGSDTYKGYKMTLTGTGWISFGIEMVEDVPTSLCFDLPLGYNTQNTKVFVISVKDKLVVEAKELSGSRFCKSDFYVKNDNSLRMISISDKGLKNYLGLVDINASEHTYVVQPQLKNKADIVEVLSNN